MTGASAGPIEGASATGTHTRRESPAPVATAGVLVGVVLFVPPLMGKARASRSARELFAKSPAINLLAAAREANVNFTMADIDRMSRNVPQLLSLIHISEPTRPY